MTLETATAPIRIKDAEGKWQDVDATLVMRPDGAVAPKAAPSGVTFAGTSGPLARIGTGTTFLSLDWLSKLPAPTLDANVATYSNIAPNLDLRMTATRLGYEQEFILKARPTAPLPTLRMPITASGLDITESAGGELKVTDSKGALVAQSTRPMMWGAARDPRTDEPLRSAPLDVTIAEGASGKVLEVSADFAFLSDPAVAYPLVIDPSPTLYVQTDTWVQSNIANTPQFGDAELKAGTYDGSTVSVSFLKFDVSQTVGKTINSAAMQIWNSHSYGCGGVYSQPVTFQRNNAAFDANTVWGNSPPPTGTVITSPSFSYGYGACPEQYATFDIKAFADSWAAGTTNHGIRMSASSSNMNAFKRFHSGDAATNLPRLTVNYNDPNVAPTAPTSPAVNGNESLTKDTGTDAPNPTPRISAIVADPDGGTLTARFYAKSVGAGTWNIIGGDSVTVSSGQRAYFTFPLDKVTVGQSFEWTVQTTDSAGAMGPTLALQTMSLSPSIMSGQPRGASLGFSLSDRVNASINAATGNLLVTTTEMTVPGVSGNVALGAVYNSQILAPGSRYTTGQSSHGLAWRQRGGRDILLTAAGDGSYVYLGPDGAQGRFTPKAGSTSAFDAPPHLKADLKLLNGEFELNDHASNSTLLFNAADILDQVIDRNGNPTTWTLDGSNRVLSVQGSRGTAQARTVTATLVPTGQNGAGLLAGYTQTVGSGSTLQTRSVAYGYDSSHRLVSITDAENRLTSFVYDTAGNVSTITTAGGASVTDIEYDTARRVTKLTRRNPATAGEPWLKDSVTRLAYPDANTVQVAGPNTDQAQAVSAVPRTTYTVDTAKRISKVVDPAGHRREKGYTQFGDVQTNESITSGGATGTGTTNTYTSNSGESLNQSAGPLGATSTADYNAAVSGGTPYQPSSTTDTLGNSTAITYEGPGNRITTTDGSTAKAEIAYNKDINGKSDGTIKSATDPNNVATANRTLYAGYSTDSDADGKPDLQLLTIAPPTGNSLGVRSATYDLFGRLKTSTTGRGIITTYTYDLLDRVRVLDFSGATPDVTYSYDPAGDLLSTTSGTGTITNTFDKTRRLLTRTNSTGGGTLTYTYDAADNLASYTDAGGTISYSHDTRDLLAGMTIPNGSGGVRYHLFFYDKDGRRTNTFYNTIGSGNLASINSFSAWLDTQYDTAGRVKRVRMIKNSDRTAAASNVVTDVSYCYARSVAIATTACPAYSSTTDTDIRTGVTDNKTGAFTGYVYSGAGRLTAANTGGGLVADYAYTYDASGNRLTANENGTTQTFTFNSANQINTTGWTYDAAGNLTISPLSGTKIYNDTDQTTSIDPIGTTTAQTSTWAGSDQSERLTIGPTSFVNGQLGVQSYTTSGNARYIQRDSTGAPISLRIGTVEHYYGLDGLGSTTSLVDSTSLTAANTTALYTYDPYGKELTATGTTATTNRIGYAGGDYQRNTGLIKFGLRYYDPASGRWTQQDNLEFLGDPAEGNRYGYARSAPTSFTDPTGQFSLGIDIEACFGLCIEVGIEVDEDLNIGGSAYAGVGTPSVGISGGGGPGTGDASGNSVEGKVGCSGGPADAELTLGSDGLNGGIGPGAGTPGCSAKVGGSAQLN